MSQLIVTIPVESDADPAAVLESAQHYAQLLASDVGGEVDEDEVSVGEASQ